MKLSVKPELLKIMTLCAGLLGFLLRTVLYSAGVDAKGLLIDGPWAAVSLWILTALVIAAILILTRSIQGPEDYQEAHPASFFGGAGSVAAAVVIVFVTIGSFGIDSMVASFSGLLAAVSLIVIGFFRFTGRKPLFLFHAALCLYFAIRMVSQYQHWNSDPQILDYVFYLSAYVMLMLTAYQHAAFETNMGSHRALWRRSLIAVYLCCVSLTGPVDTGLLLVSGIWALTNLTDLRIRRRRQRPAMPLDQEPQEEV